MKRLLTALVILTMFINVTAVHAAEEKALPVEHKIVSSDPEKDTTVIESEEYFSNVKKSTFDEQELREKLLKEFKGDENKQQFTKDIDEIVNATMTGAKKPIDTASKIVDSKNFGSIKVSEEWITDPYKYESTKYVTYRTSWLSMDNFNSSVASEFGQSKSIETTKSIGFEGSSELTASEAAKFGLKVTGSYTEKVSFTCSESYSIPAYTYWGKRTYIKWTEDKYKGELRTTYMIPDYSGLGNNYYYTEDTWEDATNSYVRDNGVKTFTDYNSNHDSTSSHEDPPEGWPWSI